MEEDLKRLIKKCDECKLNECINCEISYSDIQTIKHLIQEHKDLKEIEESHRKENGKLRERVKELEEKNRIFALEGSKVRLQIHIENNYIPKLKLKEFFSSRLEKYQEADDGRYEQEYLTRGELELVDRYKECKEIAEIILKQEVKNEIPQDCIPKSVIKEKIEELKRVINKYEKQIENDEETDLSYEEIRNYASKLESYEELLEKRK